MNCHALKMFVYAFLFSMVTATAGQARDVTLQWDPNPDPSVTGYKVYYNADSATPPFSGTGLLQGASPLDVKNLTSSTVTGLDPARTYYFAATAYSASGAESPYSNIVNVAESVPPTVSITSPVTNSTISGTVSVVASATDNVGVTKVEYYLNGILKATDTSTPYVYSLNTSLLASGTYTLMATAYDAAGNIGQSSNVSVTIVNDTTAPTVSVTAPANNATLSGTIMMSASASDNIGVSKVEFYKNGVLLYVSNVSPYNYSWNTAAEVNGSYTLSAKAYDNTGNVGQSANVVVTVNNTVLDTVAPVVSVTAPGNNATVSGTVSVTAGASDNVGVSRVEFFVSGALQATDTASPYSFSWNTASLANGSYVLTVKAYDAAGNVGQSAGVTAVVNNAVTPPAGSVTAIFGNAAGSTYPNTVEDTYLNINSDVNATSTDLNTYTWPANTPANAILTKWNLSAIPANAQIQSATLTLYMTAGGGDALYEIPVSGIINKVPVIAQSNGDSYDGTNAWTASSVPYGGIPLAQSDIAPAVDAPLVDMAIGYKNWNVTSLVKEWVVTPANNRGLLLNSSGKAGADSNRVFASSETVDANLRPKLVVTYTLASDTIAPTVAITSPVSGANIKGNVTVSIAATDNVKVSKVELYVNGSRIATDTTTPYAFTWKSGTFPLGANTLAARAYDAAGNVASSTQLSVNVLDSKAPVITINSPAAGATVGATTTINASATDNVAVTKMQIYIDNVLKTTISASSVSWSWNTTSYAAGSHIIKLKAFDAAGNTSTKSITVYK